MEKSWKNSLSSLSESCPKKHVITGRNVLPYSVLQTTDMLSFAIIIHDLLIKFLSTCWIKSLVIIVTN